MIRSSHQLIDLRTRFRTPIKSGLYKIAAPLVEKSFSIRRFNQCYASAARHYETSGRGEMKEWFGACLKSFGVEYVVDEAAKMRIPNQGPLILVANHPFGLADALILGHLISEVRPDAKILANSMLAEIPEVRPWIIAVDNFGGEGSAQRNLTPMKNALKHLRAGGALVVFPAGEVAHFQMGQGVEEGTWKSHVGALVRQTNATVVPVYFPGRNSLLFQAAGLLHPRARTALLLRELCHRRHQPISVKLGKPLGTGKLKLFPDAATLTQHLRLVTLALGHQKEADSATLTKSVEEFTEPDMLLAGEISHLRETGGLMAEQGSLSVYVAEAAQIPLILVEIGRLRETTFQAVGEGTGKEVDLDEFDKDYLHLILWDEARARIAGGYRMGRADVLLQAKGRKGLYTDTLFRFSPRFLAQMDNALELGRSFVCQEYQRHPAALLLLWKGISTWVRRNPKYKILFGPVSISDEYDVASRRLMVDFLTAQYQPVELKSLVKPRSPFRSRMAGPLRRALDGHRVTTEEELSSLISTIETDNKGMPVLLKHYLKMNASLLCFNVDRAFSSVVDGLIFVDLTKSDPRLLARYMGEEGMLAYLDHHGIWPRFSPQGQK